MDFRPFPFCYWFNSAHLQKVRALPERVQLRREAFNDFVEKQLETLQLGLYDFVFFLAEFELPDRPNPLNDS